MQASDAVASLRGLFEFIQWLDYCYGADYEERTFDEAKIPRERVIVDLSLIHISFHGCTSFRQVVEAAPRKCDCRMANAFSSDANADFEGLLEGNREIYIPQAAEK